MQVLTKDHPCVILSRGLKASAQDGPSSTKRDGLYTPIAIAERASNETTNQRAEIVNRDLPPLDIFRSVVDHQLTIPPCSRVLSMKGPSGVLWPNFMVVS